MLKKLKELFGVRYSKSSNHEKSSVEIYHVDDSNMLHTAMGISQERFDEISKTINENYSPNKHIIDLIVLVSKECRDPQELAFAMFVLGVATEKIKNPLFWEKYI